MNKLIDKIPNHSKKLALIVIVMILAFACFSVIIEISKDSSKDMKIEKTD